MTGRLLICGPGSGCGKTTVTCGLLQALVDRGPAPAAFKSGPDYIDPMFHSRIIGAPSRNLDLFLMGREGVLASLSRHGAGRLSVIEGAMGYYDGIALGPEASAYDLARQTRTPAVLVVDGRGSSLSLGALVTGFRDFLPEGGIRGVILNRVSPMLYPRLKQMLEARTGLRVYGFLPPCPEAELDSRHLGLVTAAEVPGLKRKLSVLAELARQHLDLAGLTELAAQAPPLPAVPDGGLEPVPGRPRIGLAQDRAFCFYYQDGLRLLEDLGAELVPFSPLADPALPPGLSGLYLGGGYPELYGPELAENQSLLRSVRQAVRAGMPTVAECGGYLYLHRELEDAEGRCWPMAGVLPWRGYPTGKLGRFGYVRLTARCGGLLAEQGQTLPAHEFHYWQSDAPEGDFLARKPQSSRCWQGGCHSPSLYAGFGHLHFCGVPQAARRFAAGCAAYQIRQRRDL